MSESKVDFFNNNNLYASGLFIVFFFLFDILVTAVFVLAGVSLYYPVFISLAVSIGVLAWCRYGFLHLPVSFPAVLFLALAAIVLSFLLSGLFYDYSWDGRVHFQEAVIQLAQGWNSFTTGFKYGDYWWGYRWVEAYPLGMQFYGASIYKVFGMLYAKSYNFLMLLAALFVILPCLRAVFRGLPALGITLVVIFYPCVISQLWTMYIDGLIYLLFITGAACLYFLKTTENRSFKYASAVIISGIIIYYPVFKISCVMFSGFLFLAYVWFCRKQWRYLIPFTVILPLFLIVGFQPYFNHNIFDTVNTVLFVADHSLFSYLSEVPGPVAYFKNMFYIVTDMEGVRPSGFLLKSLYYDYSWGLYGCWWVIMFFITLVYALVYIRKYKGFIVLILVMIILPMAMTSLINQRYYPLPYLFPFLVFITLYKGKALPKFMLYVLAVLMLGHFVFLLSGLIFTINTNIRVANSINDRVGQLKDDPRDLLYVDFPTLGHPLLLEKAFSDRLWLKDTGKKIYIPGHIENYRSVGERFNAGKALELVEGIKAFKLDLVLKNNDQKPFAIKVDFDLSNLRGEDTRDIFIFLNLSQSYENGTAYFTKDFTSRFIRVVENKKQNYVYFEIPPYATKVELSSNFEGLIFTGFEIREVEIKLPEY